MITSFVLISCGSSVHSEVGGERNGSQSDRVQCVVEGLQVDQEDQESNIDCSQTLRLLHLDYEYSESRLALSWILDSIQ